MPEAIQLAVDPVGVGEHGALKANPEKVTPPAGSFVIGSTALWPAVTGKSWATANVPLATIRTHATP
jgi:hypothetical protein